MIPRQTKAKSLVQNIRLPRKDLIHMGRGHSGIKNASFDFVVNSPKIPTIKVTLMSFHGTTRDLCYGTKRHERQYDVFIGSFSA